jgi:hypothetical protein
MMTSDENRPPQHDPQDAPEAWTPAPAGPTAPGDDGAAEPASPTLADRFVDVFTSPRRAMNAVAERPLWSVPFLVIFLLMALYAAANVQLITLAQQESMSEFVAPGQEGLFAERLERYQDPSVALRTWQGIQTGLGSTFIALLVPAVVLFGFCRLSEGSGSFKGTLGVVFWSGLILYGLKTILGWIVLVLTGNVSLAYLSLQSVLPVQNPMHPAFAAAGLLGDPFFWWMLWVIALGLARVHRLAERRALVVVLASHGLFSGVLIGIVALARWGLTRIGG